MPSGGGGGKRRTPAWCDRILWARASALHQLAYGRAELRASDHRPVAAAFLLRGHRYDRRRVEALLEAARRAADATEMAARPRCDVEPRFVALGAVAYGDAKRFAVAVSNTGPVDANFYYVAPPRAREAATEAAAEAAEGATGGGGARPGRRRVLWEDEQPLAPPWLQLAPEEGAVAAGERRELGLTVLISGGAAAVELANAPPAAGGGSSGGKKQQEQQHKQQQQQQPSAEGVLDAILILRIEDGSDAFVSVTGLFVRSCFGRDLTELAALGDAPAAPRAGLSAAALELKAAADAAGRAAAAAQAEAAAARAAAGAAVRAGSSSGSSDGGGIGGVGGAPEDADTAAALAAATTGGADVVGPPVELPAPVLLPKEVAALTAFLARRLATPGLFVHSYEAACGLPPRGRQPRGAAGEAALLRATAGARWALDVGEPLPEWTTAHQAAATLLALFHQLPSPLMPPSVSAVLLRAVPPPRAAAALLSDALAPAEWAAARRVLALLRAALAPDVAARNGLSLHVS